MQYGLKMKLARPLLGRQSIRPRMISRRVCCGLLSVLLTACSPIKVYAPPEVKSELPRGLRPQSLDELGRDNHGRLTEAPCSAARPCVAADDPDYEKPDGLATSAEWAWNKVPERPPKRCLALSGGGLRAATFSIGVLKGLHEAGKLKSIDVASSVSGGGYALSWYVAQKYLGRNTGTGTGHSDAELFALNGKWQQHLQRNSEFFTLGHLSLPLAVAVVPGIPLNLLANGVWGLHMNTNFLHNAYAMRLRQVYHSPPCAEGDCPPGEEIDMADLAKFMEDTKANRALRPPLFVFNSTALIDAAAGVEAGLLQNAVFEFTPWQFGSAAFGRYRYDGTKKDSTSDQTANGFSPAEPAQASALPRPPRRWSLDDLAALSGAAWDFNKFTNHPSSRQLATAGNLDIGIYIPNPRLKRNGGQSLTWLTPLAHLAGRPHYARDADGTHIYLSDGGHSENLGAFSLVRRLCQEIFIVDAEEDPGYAYDAYFKLKHAVEREMGASLNIPEIESRRRLACGNTAFCKEIAGRPQDQPAWHKSAIKPLSVGSIDRLPYRSPKACPPEPSGAAGRACNFDSIRVLYLKLAYHRDHDPEAEFIQPTELDLREVFDQTRSCQDKAAAWPEQSIKCDPPFPQLPTLSQSMSQQHFAAYRHLGCRLALGPLAKVLSDGSIDVKPAEARQRCLK